MFSAAGIIHFRTQFKGDWGASREPEMEMKKEDIEFI